MTSCLGKEQRATDLNVTIFPPRPGLNSQIRIITAVAVGGNVGPIEERDVVKGSFKKKNTTKHMENSIS